jgi:hypothetical protein
MDISKFLAARAGEPSSYGGFAALLLTAAYSFTNPWLQGAAVLGAAACGVAATLMPEKPKV